MSKTTEQLIDILSQQIELEKQAIDELAEEEEKTKESAVRLVFMDMRLSSWKHMKLLEAMINELKTSPCDEWSAKVQRYIDRVKLDRKFKSMKEKEEGMISNLDQAMEKVNDPVGKMMLEHLRQDEEAQNSVIDRVIRLIQMLPLQAETGEKGSDIVCDTD